MRRAFLLTFFGFGLNGLCVGLWLESHVRAGSFWGSLFWGGIGVMTIMATFHTAYLHGLSQGMQEEHARWRKLLIEGSRPDD